MSSSSSALDAVMESRKGVAKSWTVSGELAGQRVHNALLSLDPQTFPTATSAKKVVRKGLILLNGQTALTTHSVSERDSLQFLQYFGGIARVLPPLERGGDAPPLFVCWEDPHLAVVVKPQGVSVFTEGVSSRTSLATLLCHQLQPPSCDAVSSAGGDEVEQFDEEKDSDGEPARETESEGNKENALNYRRRPQPVHRLDRETGGLLLVAKTFLAARELTRAFATRAVRKTYWALVEGALPQRECAIRHDLDGKESITHCTQRWTTRWREREVSFVEVNPVTGRKNQIRRHLKMVGHPIVNDDRFNNLHLPEENGNMFLWATKISFPHPDTGMEVTVSLPDEFTQAFDIVRKTQQG